MKIEIPRDIYEKVMYWIDKADFEVSGFGTVLYDAKTGTFVVQDACLLKQEGGAAHTDIDANALGKLMYEIHKRKIPGELKWWWHSHVNMSVFWSGTDKETIRDLGKNGWIVATVLNKKQEMRSAFCAVTEVPIIGKQTYFVDEIETEIPDFYDADAVASWDKEFAATVTEKKWKSDYKGQPSLFNDDGKTPARAPYDDGEEDPKDWAVLKDEAAYLGMSVRDYRWILDNGTEEARMNLQARLDDYYEMLEEAEDDRPPIQIGAPQ